MKTIRRFFNNAEAEFARSLLVSVGIGAVLAESNANTLGPGYSPGGVRLQVPDGEAARAMDILDSGHGEFAPLPDDFVPPEEVSGNGETLRPGPGRVGKELVLACSTVLVAMGIVYALYMFLAPLSWTHTAAELVDMALAAEHRNDYAKAIKCLDAALIIAPNSSKIYYDRGWMLCHEKQNERAIADFTTAVALNPRYVSSYSMLGLTYKRTGEYDKALENIDQAIALDPTNYRHYDARGMIYSAMGDPGNAIEDFNRVIEKAPEESAGYNNLAWLYATWPKAEFRNGAEALQLALKACEVSDWKKSYCIGTLAAAEAETGDFDDAVRHGQRALEMAKADTSGKGVDAKMIAQMTVALSEYQQKRPHRDLEK